MFGFIGDFVEGAADAVVDVVEGAIDQAVEAVGDGAAAVGAAAVDFAGQTLETTLSLVDDTVFDTVEFISFDTIAVDYTDGTFGVSIGIDGLSSVGISVGEDGLDASVDLGLANFEAGVGPDGVSLEGSAGIDFGPLPYAEGHLSITGDGDVMINGHAQGTIPIPGGILSGEASAGFVRTDEGWGAYLEADGTYTLPSGTVFGAGVQAGYSETAEGSHTTLGLEGSVSSPGIGSAGGSVGYDRVEADGTIVEQFRADGYADGFGARIEGEAEYVGIETAEGSISRWTTDLDVTGLDADSLQKLGTSLLGLDSEEVNGVLGQVAAQGGLSELLGSLDADTTSALIERLVGAQSSGGTVAGTTSDPFADDVLDGPRPTPAGVATRGDAFDDDILGTAVVTPEGPASGAGDRSDAFDASFDQLDTIGGATNASNGDSTTAPPVAFADEVEPAAFEPKPEPTSDFSTSLDAADEVEADLGGMFDDLAP